SALGLIPRPNCSISRDSVRRCLASSQTSLVTYTCPGGNLMQAAWWWSTGTTIRPSVVLRTMGILVFSRNFDGWKACGGQSAGPGASEAVADGHGQREAMDHAGSTCVARDIELHVFQLRGHGLEGDGQLQGQVRGILDVDDRAVRRRLS